MKFCSLYYLAYLCEKYCVMEFLYDLFLKILGYTIIAAAVYYPIGLLIKFFKDLKDQF